MLHEPKRMAPKRPAQPKKVAPRKPHEPKADAALGANKAEVFVQIVTTPGKTSEELTRLLDRKGVAPASTRRALAQLVTENTVRCTGEKRFRRYYPARPTPPGE